jgi:hypothetical protein
MKNQNEKHANNSHSKFYFPTTPALPPAEKPRVPREVRNDAVKAAYTELRWLHAAKRSRAALTPEQARAVATIDGWLGLIPLQYRGAIGLRHSTKPWPAELQQKMRGYASLAIRLYCIENPRAASTATLEAEAAEHFLTELRNPVAGAWDLCCDARDYYRRAVRAYVKIRGFGRCVVTVRKRAPKLDAACVAGVREEVTHAR